MPQPVSRLMHGKQLDFTFGPDAIDREPELAALFARAIIQHSIIENAMGTLLIKILHAHAKPGYAMFSALTSVPAKLDVLTAAAEEMLVGAELSVFRIARTLASRVSRERNKLAHNLWGFSPQVPNALLMANPSVFHKNTIAWDEHWRGVIGVADTIYKGNPADLIRPNPDLIFAYRKPDFEKLLSDFRETTNILLCLTFMIERPEEQPGLARFVRPSRAISLRQLCGLRLFREERARLRAKRRKI